MRPGSVPVTGAWACDDCAEQRALGVPHGFCSGGFCAVGGHATKHPVRWYPDAAPANGIGEATSVSAKVTTQSPKVESVPAGASTGEQLALF